MLASEEIVENNAVKDQKQTTEENSVLDNRDISSCSAWELDKQAAAQKLLRYFVGLFIGITWILGKKPSQNMRSN